MSFSSRVARARARMDELDVDVLLLLGRRRPAVPHRLRGDAARTAHDARAPAAGDAQLVVPRLEAPRVEPQPDVFEIVPWDETDDPIALVAELAGAPARAAIGDQTWARFVLDLQRALPATAFVRAHPRSSARCGSSRTTTRSTALRRAAHAVDAIAAEMRAAPVRGSHRARRAPRARRAHARRRARAVELRDRRRGRARREPAPRAVGRPDHRRRRARALRLRRHDARATAPTSRACSTSASRPPRSATCTRCSRPRRKRACGPRRSARRAKRSTPPRAT